MKVPLAVALITTAIALVWVWIDFRLLKQLKARDAIRASHTKEGTAGIRPPQSLPARPSEGRQTVAGQPSPASVASGPLAPSHVRAHHAISADSGAVGGFEVRSASVIGTKNRLGGNSNQDAYRVAHVRDRFVIAAVCDGVGSAPFSHLGAQTTAESAVTAATDRLGHVDAISGLSGEGIVEEANQTLEFLANSRGDASRNYSTTLALIVIDTQAGEGEATLFALQVGDSAITTMNPDGTWTDLFERPVDQEQEVISTATDALPCDPKSALSALVHWSGPGPLVAMTDGLANPIRSSASVRAHLLDSWTAPPPALEFATQLAFQRLGEFDDRCAVAIWRPAKR